MAADPFSVLGLQPGCSKAEIKAAFRRKAMAHHPDMHNNASEHVRAANDKAFKALNEAYQALMDGDAHRYRQQRGGGGSAYGRSTYGSSYGSAGYGGAGARWDTGYDPYASSYGPRRPGASWGWQRFVRRGGLDWTSAFRPFRGLGRAEAGLVSALGLLMAGGVLLLEPLAGALWATNNEGKLFSSIEAEAALKKQQRAAAAAAERAAAAAALRRQQQEQAAAAAAAALRATQEQEQQGAVPASSGAGSSHAAELAASPLQAGSGGSSGGGDTPPAAAQLLPQASSAVPGDSA